MISASKEEISCGLLQRLLEAAWDENNTQRLLELSYAVDQHTMESLLRQMRESALA